jgi:hypothetical protein
MLALTPRVPEGDHQMWVAASTGPPLRVRANSLLLQRCLMLI